MPEIAQDIPDEETQAAIRSLAERVEVADGAPPLSDQALTQLASPAVTHFVARADGALVGYAQRDHAGAEVVGEPSALGPLLDEITRPGLAIWSHGTHSRLVEPLTARGFTRSRELHQLRRGLAELPPAPELAAGIQVRTFRPGEDDAAWLAVNAAAFAHHPEQGHWTQSDLDARIAESWFEPAGFLLAYRGAELLGFHWTKVHPDGAGEVYVLGVAPAAQGLGLGNALLVRGLRYLAERRCPYVLLYVDGDNPGAIRLYERAGFRRHDLDIQWRAP